MATGVEIIQNKIEREYLRPIRLEKMKRKRNETLHEFLIKFFEKWNGEKDTIYVDNKQVQTKARSNYHQNKASRRSFGDIYMICKYYYPNVTVKDVLYELYVGLRQHFTQGYRTSYCNYMGKRAFYYDEDMGNLEYDKTTNDEYGHQYKYYMNLFKQKTNNNDYEDEL